MKRRHRRLLVLLDSLVRDLTTQEELFLAQRLYLVDITRPVRLTPLSAEQAQRQMESRVALDLTREEVRQLGINQDDSATVVEVEAYPVAEQLGLE